MLEAGQGPVAVLTKPPGGSNGSDVAVIIVNSGLLHRVGPFGLYVALARRLAERGFPALRIDLSGKGDSARRIDYSFEDSIQLDYRSAADFLSRSVGAKRFVVVGLCSGADDALLLAEKFPNVCGAVLFEAVAFRTPKYFLRHYGRRIFRLDLYWIAAGRVLSSLRSRVVKLLRLQQPAEDAAHLGTIREFSGPEEIRDRYHAVTERGVELLCVFTDGSRSYYNYVGQLVGVLNSAASRQHVTELYLSGAKHTYPLVKDRDEAIDAVVMWFESKFPSASGE